MKNPFVYAKNVLHFLMLKIKYNRKLHTGFVQSFEKVRLEIGKDASVTIGSYNQNRGSLYIGVIGDGDLTIGNHCFFNINSSITCAKKIVIGDNCKFGNNIVIVDHDHNFRAKGKYSEDSPEFISSPIIIGNNVWVGAGAIILRGTNIGDNCVISAGSMVKGTIHCNTVFVRGEERPY